MSRRFIGLTMGIIYGIGYGFWTAVATGGGHGNLIFFIAFSLTYFFGLFFPVAGFLVADLEPLWARVVLITLLFLNLFATILLVYSTAFDELAVKDVTGSWARNSGFFVAMSAAHCVPLFILWTISLRKIWSHDSETLPA